jgi:hypothetical protein
VHRLPDCPGTVLEAPDWGDAMFGLTASGKRILALAHGSPRPGKECARCVPLCRADAAPTGVEAISPREVSA